MSGYTNVFSGSQVVLPSSRSYSLLTMTATTTLVWPEETASDADQLTAILDVTANAGLQLRLPPGNEASPGSAAVIVNTGAHSVDLRVNSGASSIATIAAGTALYVWLTSNATTNGSWQSAVLGAGSVAPSLASQTGAGLVYFNGLLNAGYPTETIATSSYALTEGDRATALVNTGGALTVSFASGLTAFESDFFFIARNDGSGSMTLDPYSTQTIDGQSTVVLSQGQSCFVILDGSTGNWRTVGRQTTNSTSLTSGVINVAGTGDYAMTSSDVAFGLQEFQGVLTGNRTITYGSLTGVWYVYNNTSGAYTLTFRVDGSDPGVVVDQGAHAIIVLNGVNAALAFSSGGGGGGGTVTSITFQAPLSGGTITGSGTVGLANSGVSGGTYGGTDGWPQVVVTTKGLITSATTLPSSALSLPYLPTTGGTGTGNYGLVGAVTVNSLSGTSGTFSGPLSGSAVSGTTASFSGAGTFGSLQATSGTFSGAVSGSSFNGTSGAFGSLSGTSGTFSGTVSANTFSGTTAAISGTGAFGVVTANGTQVRTTSTWDVTAMPGGVGSLIAGTYLLCGSAPSPGTVSNFIYNVGTNAGSATAAVQINGSNITGLSGLTVSASTDTLATATSGTFSAGDKFSLVISGVSTPAPKAATFALGGFRAAQ